MKKILALAAAVVVSTASFASAETVVVKGSDTLINLVQRLAEVYMEQGSGKVSVTGGGSGTGISAIINKKCDIANASRPMKDKEISQGMDRGVAVKRVVVAVDGLSVIVSDQNSVTELTSDQIAKIFKGEYTNWSQLGGDAGAITLYGRQPNSGTFDFFREYINGEYSPKMRQMNGNAQIVEAVKSDAGGIGYIGVGYLKEAEGVHALRVAAREGAEYVDPMDKDKVESGEYPISRPLNQYVDTNNLSQAAKDFLMFELSPEGQQIVEEEGFFAIPPEYQALNQRALGI